MSAALLLNCPKTREYLSGALKLLSATVSPVSYETYSRLEIFTPFARNHTSRAFRLIKLSENEICTFSDV